MASAQPPTLGGPRPRHRSESRRLFDRRRPMQAVTCNRYHCPGALHAGDPIRVFSRSANMWVDGEVMELTEDNFVRIEYAVDQYWCGKWMYLHSEHVKILNCISSSSAEMGTEETAERDCLSAHGNRGNNTGRSSESIADHYDCDYEPDDYDYDDYEVKHSHDEQLANLKEVRKKCGLKKVNVKDAFARFKAAAAGEGRLSQKQFAYVYEILLSEANLEPVTDEVKRKVFNLFDRDDNGTVDMMELMCGVCLLCKGDENAKLEAVFVMFDDNGDGFVSVDEMHKFLTTVFKVACTPKVMENISAAGAAVTSIEDMANATVTECFAEADLDKDGKLSLDEFKRWFDAPRNNPDLLFTPVVNLFNRNDDIEEGRRRWVRNY